MLKQVFFVLYSLTSVSLNIIGLNCSDYLKLDADAGLLNPYSINKVESGPVLL